MERKEVIDLLDLQGLREWLENIPQTELALLEITRDEFDTIKNALIILRREARPYEVNLWAATECAFKQLMKSVEKR